MWSAWEWEYTMWVTVLDIPFALVMASIARSRLWPMVGGASMRTTPSRVVKNMA